MTKTTLAAVLSAGMLAIAASTAMAQSAADTIATRQAGFKAIAASTGEVKKALDAGADLTPVAANAQEVVDFARKIPVLFPAGTDNTGATKTRALPAIWQNKANFDTIAATLAGEGDKLVAALRANDKTAATAAFAAMTNQCGVCHRPYRAPQ
jgi:cytochrome c556